MGKLKLGTKTSVSAAPAGEKPAFQSLEIGIAIRGSMAYQSVGGHAIMHFSEDELAPIPDNKEAIEAKVRECFEKLDISVGPLTDRITGGLEYLAKFRKEHEKEYERS